MNFSPQKVSSPKISQPKEASAKPTFQKGTPPYQYQHVQTNRKRTVSIVLEQDIIKIITPKRFPIWKVNKLIQEKKKWIDKKRQEQKNVKRHVPKKAISGEKYPLLDDRYWLKVVNGTKKNVFLEDDWLIMSLPSNSSKVYDVEARKDLLKGWYKTQALQILLEKTAIYAKKNRCPAKKSCHSRLQS